MADTNNRARNSGLVNDTQTPMSQVQPEQHANCPFLDEIHDDLIRALRQIPNYDWVRIGGVASNTKED